MHCMDKEEEEDDDDDNADDDRQTSLHVCSTDGVYRTAVNTIQRWLMIFGFYFVCLPSSDHG